MDRRRFVQLAGLAGLGFIAPVGLKVSRADSGKYGGPYFIMVDANGGWDPTFCCDPKGGDIDRPYTVGQIGTAGNIHYAPISGVTSQSETFYTNQAFFEKYYSRLMILNGVDTETNNHDSGTRTTWSGQLDEGYPSFGALAAAVALEKLNVPLAFLSAGGYDATEGVCSLSRVGDPDVVEKLAYTNTINPGDTANATEYYNTPTTAARIAAAQAARLQAKRDKQSLPAPKAAMSSLFLTRSGSSGLGELAQELATTPLLSPTDLPDLAHIQDTNSLNDLKSVIQQAQLAVLAFQAGVAVSANLNITGFDTHSNHDANQSHQMASLLRGLAFLFDLLDSTGLADKTYVIVGSDFGRTPTYNADGAGGGKDHWNITSMMLAGPTVQGNLVIGGTDSAQVSTTVNEQLQPDSGGFRVTTPLIHVALRKLAGVTGTANDLAFPLAGDVLPFFG
ncbi:MAG TPA: DUF1501 domain-containing protein [Byssovorax sp.]|jgi:uncharacterized protein (DUF1501 family)